MNLFIKENISVVVKSIVFLKKVLEADSKIKNVKYSSEFCVCFTMKLNIGYLLNLSLK